MQVVSDYAWYAGCNFCIFRIAYHTARKKIRRGFVNDIEFAETLPQKNYKENQQSYEATYDQYHTRIPALSRKR